MATLPTPGGDFGTWGTELNDFLTVGHDPDGTLKTLPYVDVREFGTVDLTGSADATAVMQSAASTLLATGDGALYVPAGKVKLSDVVQFCDAINNRRVALRGAGVGVTQFTGAAAAAQLAFGEPHTDGTVNNATSTTTVINAATGTFPANAAGQRISVVIAGTTTAATILTRNSATQVTLTAALSAVPDTPSQWTVFGSGVRGNYAANFSFNGNSVANQPLYIGEGAHQCYHHIRVYAALLDGIVISGAENGSMYAVEASSCGRDCIAFTHGAKNFDLVGCFTSTGGQSNIHFVQRGLSSNTTKTPEKIKFFGGILEEWDAVGVYKGTIYVEDGDLLEFYGCTISGAAHGNTTDAAVYCAPVVSGTGQRIDFTGGQLGAVTGVGLNLGGASSSKPIEITLNSGVLLRGASAIEFLRIRDDNVRFETFSPLHWAAAVKFAATGTATRTWQDVVALNGARTLVKAADTARVNATVSADPHLTCRVEVDSDYEIAGLLIVDGVTAADLQIGFSAPTSATFDWSRVGFGADGTTVGMGASIVSDLVTLGTVGVGTKLAYRFHGLLRTVGTPGTFALRWAQQTTNATATTLYTGSYMTVRATGSR